jgi:hypothetical protein
LNTGTAVPDVALPAVEPVVVIVPLAVEVPPAFADGAPVPVAVAAPAVCQEVLGVYGIMGGTVTVIGGIGGDVIDPGVPEPLPG